jgi:glycosyltransferase involved in cell wall biosynthesis
LKTRILYVLPTGERGGAEVLFLNILENLNRNLYEPFVICLQDGPFITDVKKDGLAEPIVLKTDRIRSLNGFFKTTKSIRQIIESQQIDVVHSNGTGAQIYAGFAAGLTGTPCIYHLHDTVEWSWTRQGLIHFFAKMSLPISTIFSGKRKRLRFVAVSNYVAERFQQSWGLRNNIHIIHNTVRFTDSPTKTGSKMDKPLVVWIGRLQRWKGTHIFLKAAAIVNEKFPEAQFCVVGGTLFGIESEYQKELKDLAESLNLNGSLNFAGHQSCVQSFLNSADIVVHSSIQPEPFGLVLLEAMNAGKPVVASNKGGPVEIVENGVTGYLIPPNDPQELANAIITLLRNGTLRTKMGQAAQERVKKHFNPSKMIQQLQSLYSELAFENTQTNEHH